MPNDYTGLLTGSHWSGIEVMGKPVIVTYSFPTTVPGYVPGINDPGLTATALASWQAFNAGEQAMARTAMAEWADECGLIFVEVAAGLGDVNFQKLDFSGTRYDGAGGIAYRPFGDWSFASYPSFTSDLDAAGDVFMNSDIALVYGTVLHEIGHAIGLKHPTESWTQFAGLPPVVHNVWTVDDPALTIMSQLPGGTGHLTAFDRQAVAAIYGTQAQDGTQVASWSWNAATQVLTQTGFATPDVIRGSSVADVISSGNGADQIFGLAGNDTLRGGNGNDTLDGGAGKDVLGGGDGDDHYYVTAGDRIIEGVSLLPSQDTVHASISWTLAANVEILYFSGAASVTGKGNAQNNEIYADRGAAVLYGLSGEDYLVGSDLRDLLIGGTGGDVMYGRGGADRFIFQSAADFVGAYQDAIGDFSRSERDKIDLRAIDPDAVTAGDQAFSFVGTAAFTVDARFQVRYELVGGGDTQIQIDLNRDAVTDVTILMLGITTPLFASDFLL